MKCHAIRRIFSGLCRGDDHGLHRVYRGHEKQIKFAPDAVILAWFGQIDGVGIGNH